MSKCHICGHELEPKLDLGRLPLANAFVFDFGNREVLYDGVWSWCSECQLLQLAEPPKSSDMFTEDYPYKTSTSQTMLNHFEKAADELDFRYDPAIVGEIGCSDGGMLQFLPDEYTRIGFEPSKACWKALADKDIRFYPAFDKANVDSALDYMEDKFDLLYSANTLRSIPELGDILSIAQRALNPIWGVLVIEEPHLIPIIGNNEFDQFYDENVFCFTGTSVARIAERFGLRLYDAESTDVHGGSLRYHLCQIGDEHIFETERLKNLVELEAGIYELLNGFNETADRVGRDFQDTLVDLKVQGKRVVGYGATAKSSTMLCGNGIASNLIQCIYDNTPSKIGRFTPVSHIPVVDANEFENEPDDTICVLFAWNHQREILSKVDPERKHKWIVYVPEVTYI